MSSSSEVKLEDLRISLEEIKSSTENFSPENYIGGGGFGKVYKGNLSNSRGHGMVAIKQLNPEGGQGKQEFRNEVSMLYSYKHKNIITFVGYCDEGNQMIIVYEYAVNGSLDKHLRDADKMRCLSWEQRLKICIGAAEGLDYLHSGIGADIRVIHRDVKSSNVLLDGSFEAKISDFGLSKFGPRNQPYTQLNTRVAGTGGYCDPHYHETGELTKESDVYSFGVVLFEVLCGRLVFPERNCSQDDDDSRSLVDLVRCYYKERLDNIIDPHIRDQIEPKSLDAFKEIAYQCLKINYRKRPEMAAVVRELKAALNSQVTSSGLERPRTYEVFVSFHGDVRNTFVSHLYSTLHQKGINTFMDTERIDSGSSIAAPVIEAIKRSSIAIVIFSKAYGACLNELVEIMNCHKEGKITVMPVFYDVSPSKVLQSQIEHATMSQERSAIWRDALVVATDIYGWDLSNIANVQIDEVQSIQEIVESVSYKLRTNNSNYFRQEHPRTYDVFLCFRGPDVRTTFLAHLRNALNRNKISTFYDFKNIDRGSSIACSILQGLERSLISIVIFSKGFAESQLCLNDLVAVMNWHEATGKPMIPVFYHVERSGVQNKTGDFAEAFHKHELWMQPKEITLQRKALVQAASFSGWDLSNSDNRNEAQRIQEIVQVVSDKLRAIKSNALA